MLNVITFWQDDLERREMGKERKKNLNFVQNYKLNLKIKKKFKRSRKTHIKLKQKDKKTCSKKKKKKRCLKHFKSSKFKN